jgi:hypothetical protein
MIQTAVLPALVLTLGFTIPERAVGETDDAPNGVFDQFTRHIQDHIASDKIAFVEASGCTNWFYQQKKRSPASSDAHRIRLDLALDRPSREHCFRLYPGGLNEVRQDLQRTQSSLSVSLTSYQFALVGDRDDDAQYSRTELRDLFQSLSLTYDPAHSLAAQATALTERFDVWYRTKNLENMMAGMSWLYEQGYRVTPADRAEFERVSK